MDGEAATAAANHLFEVNEKNPIMLDEDKATVFHHNEAKLLFFVLASLTRHPNSSGIAMHQSEGPRRG
jgi:hypothetical protein